MAIGLSVAEYTGYAFEGMPVAQEPSLAEYDVAIGASSVASGAFNASTRLVRLCADASCSVAFGSAPTATVTNKLLPAGVPEYFVVQAGWKVAVIANS